jgi:alanine racemase
VTLQLNVDSAAWRRHVSETAKNLGDLIPVVKGNGYGFGRATLIEHAQKISRDIAVGTIFEIHDVPPNCRAFVLTPVGKALPPNKNLAKNIVLTVGSVSHVQNLRDVNWHGDVVIKLRSSMNRYGADSSELNALVAAVQAAGLTQIGWSVHPPLDGTPQSHATEIGNIISNIDSDLPSFVSHIDADSLVDLCNKFANKTIRVRSGTQLWLGDKSMFELNADVLDARPVKSGAVVGYRNITLHQDGTLIMIGAGTSHGVQLVGAELSPFHFNSTRLSLVEPSHMHTSMVFVPANQTAPKPGDMVDVQQPLTRVYPDIISWI